MVHENTNALRTAPGADKDWAAMTEQFKADLPKVKLRHLADSLGVLPKALRQLHVGWCGQEACFTFPEFSGTGEVIGISKRPADGGKKKVVVGGKRGIYVPPGWKARKGPIFIVEGVSDTAALITMGLAGVGRPSANGGVDFLADLFADLPPERHIVIVAEYDMKCDGSWPGLNGAKQMAKKLSDMLGRKVRWALRPSGAKDIRAWL
jgi:hypothetical protein